MKRIFAILLLLSVFFTSCKEEESHIVRKVNQEVLIFHRIQKIHNYSAIASSLNEAIDMDAFFETFGIEYYKSVDKITYTVLKTDKGLCLVLFDENLKNGTIQMISFSDNINATRIESLKIGMTLEEVQRADPDAQYGFLLHSWSGYPQISYHCFEDGRCFSILYENEIIVEITCFTL